MGLRVTRVIGMGDESTGLAASQRPLWAALVRSPWLWLAAVVALATSPMLFLSSLVVGVAACIVGAVLWGVRRHVWLLAAGIGLVLGAVPYSLAALRVLNL